MIKRFFDLEEKIQSYYPQADLELIKKAYTIAAQAHKNQLRASKDPYIVHPLSVAEIIADLKLDEISVAAALLHDVLEDSDFTEEKIAELLNPEIARIVKGVTKISKITKLDREVSQAETLKKMILAMVEDVRVILIKLADRLHNIRTLSHLPPEKQKRIAKETLDIYAPIAYRLGMGKVRDELEDFAFFYLYPEEHRKITESINIKHGWAIQKLEEMKKEIEKILQEYKIKAQITHRIKRIISIWRKLQRQNIEIDNVYDLLALRVITDTIANCYAIMGGIHQCWTHIPSRWRDFITNPKNNYYQSIHTTVINREGIKFEIQIRTFEMHRNAEEGIAAHWKYKEGLDFLEKDSRLNWFRTMINYHKNNPDPKEFLNLVKKDLTPDEVIVKTPKGEDITLKYGSTVLDFAYSIHSNLGDHCQKAIINEKIVPLKTKLNSGDIVQIITSSKVQPTVEWLKYVITDRARKKILAFLKKEENRFFQEQGEKAWQKAVRNFQRKFRFKIKPEKVLEYLREHKIPDWETFYREIGAGRKKISNAFFCKIFPEIVHQEINEKAVPKKEKPAASTRLISVDGLQGIDFTFARCCSPLYGDEIVGYMTKSRGMVIHRNDCPTLQNAEEDRFHKVIWNPEVVNPKFSVKIQLLVEDRPGILSQITGVPAAFNCNIKTIEQQSSGKNSASIKMTLEVKSRNQFEKMREMLSQISGIYSLKLSRG